MPTDDKNETRLQLGSYTHNIINLLTLTYVFSMII